MTKDTLIGFVGQGWIGKHYADDFEVRGYEVIRYSLEDPYKDNKEAIAKCDIVFIAVPTPTTPDGFDDSIVRSLISLVGKMKIAVIKSTIVPGTTLSIQEQYPDIFVLHSPEFLREQSAAYDASHPERNIVGIPIVNDLYTQKAQEVLKVLPHAPYEKIFHAKEAELIKYAGNSFLYTKVVFMNMLYDLVQKSGGNWEHVREAMIADPRIGESHTQPVHSSGRGAGGHCFIKDFEAFRLMYMDNVGDHEGNALLAAEIAKNNSLLKQSNKDIDLLKGVYGSDV